MAVRFALIILLSLIAWAQEKSSNTASPKTTPNQAENSSQTDKATVKQISDSPVSDSPASDSNAVAGNPGSSKKRSHTPVQEHVHTTPVAAPAVQEKPFPIQLAGQPLDRWIRIYMIATGAAAVLGLMVITLMWRQLKQLRIAREQSDRIARRANEQIGAMRDAADQTDRMIQQLVEQVRIAAEQVKSATMAAWAARNNEEDSGSSVHNGHIAEEAMRLQQRAWVFVTEIRASELQAGRPLDITLGFKNTGRTPARNVQIATQVDSLPKGRDPEPRLEKAYSRGIIPPEGTVFANIGNSNGHSQGLTQEDLQAIKSGDLVVWAYGTLTYDDVFEVRQATMFCYRLQPDRHTFAVAEVYNDAT